MSAADTKPTRTTAEMKPADFDVNRLAAELGLNAHKQRAAKADELLEEAAMRVAKSAAALRALADLTGGASLEVAHKTMNEVKREDLASLLSLVEESTSSALDYITNAQRGHRLVPHSKALN